MKLSIVDVAQKAGVSTATVSRVFNRQQNVKEDVAKHVIDVATSLGYSPHYSIKRECIVLLVEAPDRFRMESYGAMIYSSLIRISCGLNLRLELLTTDDIPKLKDSHTLGVISLVFTPDSIKAVQQIKDIPLISLNVKIPGVRSICSDEKAGVEKAVRHLKENGHRKIGMVSCDIVANWATTLRIESFEQSIESQKLETFIGQVQKAQGENGLMRALSSLMKRDVTAIFIPGERWGMIALHSLELFGKKVPEDISLIGYEYIDTSEFLNPPMTSLRQDLDKIIKGGMDALLAKPKKATKLKKRNDETTWVDIELIPRESVESINR